MLRAPSFPRSVRKGWETSHSRSAKSSSRGIQQPTINQQNIYAMVDFYLPPVEPAWTKYRFIPHPIFGMPIKKQPLRNTTAGLAIGLKYLQPFGCVVFNVQQRKTSGNTLVNHLVFKGAWGITISLTDAAKLIKASSTNKTASTTATKAASSP